MIPGPPRSTLFPYPTLFQSVGAAPPFSGICGRGCAAADGGPNSRRRHPTVGPRGRGGAAHGPRRRILFDPPGDTLVLPWAVRAAGHGGARARVAGLRRGDRLARELLLGPVC